MSVAAFIAARQSGRRACRVGWAAALVAGAFLRSDAAFSSEGERFSSEQGRFNGLSRPARHAPPLDRLVDEMHRMGDDDAALRHMPGEVREQTWIHAHQMIGVAPALRVLRWLAQGG